MQISARGDSKLRGFTLVELLVVIAIIGMLAGLLLPAIQAARESGRRTVCANNMRNVGFACITYDESKSKYPDLLWVQQMSDGNPYARALIYALLPQLERNDIYDRYSASPTGEVNLPVWNDPVVGEIHLDVLTCPSDQQSVGAGMAFCFNAGNPSGLTYSAGNGVFEYGRAYGARGSNGSNFVNSKDGLVNTAMVTENIDGGTWTGTDATGAANYYDRVVQGFLWDNYLPADWPTYRINANKGLSPNQVSNNQAFARPSSNHPQLVNMYFCDGHLVPIKDDIDYRVYVALMTSHGATSTDTANGSPLNVWGREWILDDSQY